MRVTQEHDMTLPTTDILLKPLKKRPTSPMKQRYLAIPAAIFLALTGCEALGPAAVKKTQLPANLRIEPINKPSDSRPIESEPLAAAPHRPAEYYPAKGNLLGHAGATIASAPASVAKKIGKYTLNFDDADLNEVAKTILDEALKINYVISPKVTGRVTLQTTRPLTDDELLPTLEMLLKLNSAVLIKDHAMYRIEPEASATVNAPGASIAGDGRAIPPGYRLQVIPLRFIGAQEMQKVLEPMMPAKSILKVDVARNMLLLAGSSDELASVLDTVQLFDVDFMRGMSVGLFPIANAEPELIAMELEKVMGDTAKGPLAGLLRLMPIERLNAVLAITAQPRYLEEIASWIGRLDRYSPNRNGGVHVYRVQNVDAVELAKTLSNIFGGGSGSSNPSLRPGSQGSQIGATSADTPGAGGSGFSNSNGDMGSNTSGDLGLGSSSGSMASTMGANYESGSGGSSGSSSMGGSSGGMGGSSSSGSGGLDGGFGSSGGGMGGMGGMGGGIGRGTSASRNRGSVATNLSRARIVADPTNNALIITAKAQDYKEIESVIKELDVMPYQVLVDATIAEVALTDELKFGIKWYFQQGSNAEGLKGVISDSVMNNVTEGLKGYAFSYSLVALGKDVRVLLQAQADKGKVNMLASPSLMVLNNQEASMRVGDQVPILTGQYGNFTGGSTTVTGNPVYSSFNSVQYRDTGVLLNVRPRVNAGGLVTLDIIQSVSNVDKSQQSKEINSPTISQRQIKSSVAVKNGETLVLGGLIREDNAISRSGIPLLMELPWLGDFFSGTNMAALKRELVVLLTPRIVDSELKSREVSNEFRRKLTGLYEDQPLAPRADSNASGMQPQ